MPLSLRGDPSRPGGGFAILRSDERTIPPSIAVEDRSLGLFLTVDGQWSKQPTLFDVEAVEPSVVRLGPTIVDAIASDTAVAIHGPDGVAMGTLVWPSVRPSAGASQGAVLPTADAFASPHRPLPAQPAPPPETPATPAAPTPQPQAETKPPLAPPTSPRRAPWTAVAALLVAALALFALLRDGPIERRLVCSHDAPLHGETFGGLLAACPAPLDPELAVWAEFGQCVASCDGCGQKACADAYLKRFAERPHGDAARRVAGAAQDACRAEDEARHAAADFDAFAACLSSARSCGQAPCLERYAARLTREPYATKVRRARDAVAACAKAREDEAFAAFSLCVAAAQPCDRASCADAASAIPEGGVRRAEVQAILAEAETACHAETESKRAAADFAEFGSCLRSASACEQAACVDRWQSSLKGEPYTTMLRQARDAATVACDRMQEEAAFSTFGQCVARSSDCERAS